MELHEDVVRVELAAEERLHAELAEELVRLVALGHRVLERGLLGGPLLHLGELEHHARILNRLRERIERIHVRALGVRLRDDFLGFRLVVPEIARRLLGLQLRETLPAPLDVDVRRHLPHRRAELLYALLDLLDLEQLFLLFFLCHGPIL